MNGKEYVCLGVENCGGFGIMLRIVDDDDDDWNYDDSPDWKAVKSNEQSVLGILQRGHEFGRGRNRFL